MATNQISFGGNILPCTVERFPAIKKAQRKFRQYNIPGRNGDIFFQDDAYENVIQSYEVYAGDGTYGSQHPWTELARCLYLDGYQELRDTYDPDHFRKAVFNGPIEVENSWNTHGRATLEFNCRPERYLIDGRNAVSYAHQLGVVYVWLKEELSAYLQSSTVFGNVDTEYVWSISIPAGTGVRTVKFNWRDDGTSKTFSFIDPGDETTATTSFTRTIPWSEAQIPAGAGDLLVPGIYYDGQPVIEVDGVPIGAVGVLNNPYMPSYPDIVLHNVASYYSEEVAFVINNKVIYIDYNSNTPYYFIDTENQSVTCSGTLTGERVQANNVWLPADLRLLSGQNMIYTTEYYDAVITPNWWEL